MSMRNMRKLRQRYAVLFVLFVWVCGFGQTAQKTEVKPRRLVMWKASSPTTTVYLLGSVHLGDKDLYPLPEVVESTFNASKVLVVEVNLKNVDQASAIKLVTQAGFYSGGDTLAKHLSKSTSDALDDFCSKNGMPRSMMDMFKP